jgi:sugar phosphate isomerase/epimerase
MTIDSRLGCSTISFRRWPLPEALAEIKTQGFGETDLGSLPGVCDHVPIPLPGDRVDALAEQILNSGVKVRLINADVADMDDPALDEADMQRRLRTLVDRVVPRH